MALFDDIAALFSGGPGGLFAGMMPQQQQQPAPQPQQTAPAAPPGPDFGDRLMAGFQGLTQSSSPISALGNLVSGLATGQRTDPSAVRQQQLTAMYSALRQRGLSESDARAAVLNPKFMEAILPSAVPKYAPFSQGQNYGNFNPATGNTNVQGSTPSWQTMTPGQVGGFATPPSPTPIDSNLAIPPRVVAQANAPAAGSSAPIVQTAIPTTSVPPGGLFSQVATGGPKEPPNGYDYVDPKDPSKGLRPTPGGPATVIPGDVAGRLAMLQAARPAIEEAKKYFTDPRGLASSAAGYVGQAAGQRLGVGEIGRQQRNVAYAVETALRVATGATAPPDEVKSYANMYTPSLYDSQKTREQKMSALDRFVTFAERNMGAGRMPPPETFLKAGTDKAQDRVPDPPAGFLRQ